MNIKRRAALFTPLRPVVGTDAVAFASDTFEKALVKVEEIPAQDLVVHVENDPERDCGNAEQPGKLLFRVLDRAYVCVSHISVDSWVIELAIVDRTFIIEPVDMLGFL